ncbi:hypothetical protein O181_035929 [Austropuccinia psidii MF-1]|uniref:Uncharacterized protein n=1 Tax=Austropuccinia psidii MF-1 TaxID=1389203 RepID=A0A9Q3D3P4_9BASI|nr:hypothetical protein [Austropuccinia psidii MF-1]
MTFRLMSQNQRWLQHNTSRNCFVSPSFSSPLLCPSSACPTTPRSIIIIDDTPFGSPTPPPSTPTLVPSPDLPPIYAENPATSSHSYDDARQEFTNLRPTLMIP